MTTDPNTWCNLTGYDWAPHKIELRKMLALHDPAIVEQALKITAVKLAGGLLRQRDGWLKYMWGILWKSSKEQDSANRET